MILTRWFTAGTSEGEEIFTVSRPISAETWAATGPIPAFGDNLAHAASRTMAAALTPNLKWETELREHSITAPPAGRPARPTSIVHHSSALRRPLYFSCFGAVSLLCWIDAVGPPWRYILRKDGEPVFVSPEVCKSRGDAVRRGIMDRPLLVAALKHKQEISAVQVRTAVDQKLVRRG
jgi:hypothetical protein